jgi:hypothetical protein
MKCLKQIMNKKMYNCNEKVKNLTTENLYYTVRRNITYPVFQIVDRQLRNVLIRLIVEHNKS